MLSQKRLVKAVAAIILIIAAALFTATPRQCCLTVRDHETGKVYARYPMEEGERFSIEFKHSVNLSPVIDVYEITDGEIYIEETIYYHFGAGVQTQLNEGETLRYGEDGSMIVGNIHQLRSGVLYIVGTKYDHMLTLNNGEKVNLAQLCGKNTKVSFHYERVISFK